MSENEADPVTNPGRVLSPTRLAWRKLKQNRLAMAGAITLAFLYAFALLAGFFSPYSPTESEFRSLFYHPPSELYFRADDGKISLRPYVARTFLADSRSLTYSSGPPLRIVYRNPAANVNPYLPDTIEANKPVLVVQNERMDMLASTNLLQETSENSGRFYANLVPNPELVRNSRIIVIQSGGQRAEFPVLKTPPQPVSPASSEALLLQDENGQFVSGYYAYTTKFPIKFFVRSWRYNILGIVQSNLHLFGVEEPGHVFLLGTDQSGRDIFSRVLYGAQISLTVGLVGVLLTTILGLILGGVAGYYGGTADNVIMRSAEVMLSVPALYLILTIRNVIPDRMEDFYQKLQQFGMQTFAWQGNPTNFWIIIAIIVLFLSYYVYRKHGRRSSLLFSLAVLLLAVFGPAIVSFTVTVLRTIVPGSSHITSRGSYFMIILILSLVGWAAMARVIRGMVLSLREQEYVVAARALGASDARIILRHILPNTIGYVLVRATLLIPAYILGEVALSFLSVGVQEPIPSWGNMLTAAQNLRVLQQFTWTLAPGFLIFLTVLAYNFLGDGLRDALDPRKRA
jgi:peptide/nickel transport system permease protein